MAGGLSAVIIPSAPQLEHSLLTAAQHFDKKYAGRYFAMMNKKRRMRSNGRQINVVCLRCRQTDSLSCKCCGLSRFCAMAGGKIVLLLLF